MRQVLRNDCTWLSACVRTQGAHTFPHPFPVWEWDRFLAGPAKVMIGNKQDSLVGDVLPLGESGALVIACSQFSFGANRRHPISLRAISWSYDALKRSGRGPNGCLRKDVEKGSLTDCSKTWVRTTELHSVKYSPLLSVIDAGSNPVGASKGGRGITRKRPMGGFPKETLGQRSSVKRAPSAPSDGPVAYVDKATRIKKEKEPEQHMWYLVNVRNKASVC